MHSVLSPGVRVNSYCEVEYSILMPGVEIGRYSRIRRAIINTGVKIPDSSVIGFDPDADRARGLSRHRRRHRSSGLTGPGRSRAGNAASQPSLPESQILGAIR